MSTDCILYIVVIYRIRPEESRAYCSLCQLLGEQAQDNIYLHDNTEENIFLAGAYNKGLQVARERGKEWIVLLDSDTALTAEYLQAIHSVAEQTEQPVWVPTLVTKAGKKLSPFTAYGIPTAFNSGMLVRREVIEDMGGFNTAYPIDYLDYWFCRELNKRGFRPQLLNVSLTHSLSLLDYSAVTPARYQTLLLGEKQFARESGHAIRHRIHLLLRAIKWTLIGHRYTRETWRALWS